MLRTSALPSGRGGKSVADFEPMRDGKPSYIKLKERDETRPQHPLVMKHEIKAIWGMKPIFESPLKRNKTTYR